MNEKKYAVGADIGGSHISCALIDITNGELVERSRSGLDIDNQAEAEVIFKGWASALMNTIEMVGLEQVIGIGFAMPGPFDYLNGIAHFDHNVAKFENLHGLNVATEIRNRLSLPVDCPVCFMNDASAFAAGEAWVGAAADKTRSISITLGTGFGTALIVDGLPIVKGKGIPPKGCFYHVPFKDSIAEHYFCTRWFTSRWKEISGQQLKGVKPIADLSSTDERAMNLFVEYGQNMAEFLSPWLKEFEADALVFGGNVTGAYHLFGPSFEKSLADNGIELEIMISTLKEDAAMIGAARLIDVSYMERIAPVLPEM